MYYRHFVFWWMDINNRLEKIRGDTKVKQLKYNYIIITTKDHKNLLTWVKWHGFNTRVLGERFICWLESILFIISFFKSSNTSRYVNLFYYTYTIYKLFTIILGYNPPVIYISSTNLMFHRSFSGLNPNEKFKHRINYLSFELTMYVISI